MRFEITTTDCENVQKSNTSAGSAEIDSFSADILFSVLLFDSLSCKTQTGDNN